MVELAPAALLHRHGHEEFTAILGENRLLILEMQLSVRLAHFSLHFLISLHFIVSSVLLCSEASWRKPPLGFKQVLLSLTKMWLLKLNIVHAMNYTLFILY